MWMHTFESEHWKPNLIFSTAIFVLPPPPTFSLLGLNIPPQHLLIITLNVTVVITGLKTKFHTKIHKLNHICLII
jgi:hypothetical protein